MKKRIKRFGVVQTASMFAIVYFVFMAIIMIPFGLIMTVVGLSGFSDHSHFLNGFGAGGIFFVFLPFIYAGIAFVMTAIGCLVYNLAAKWIGGIEVEIDDQAEVANNPFQ
ncbi:hypothetical protein FKX85_05245 [Echinicola soli]|uniref:DUF3566 domain-containing protein n=1 Tax=Echinicola soli TaxID=2591634 RepID=A0A514CF97_9BACT|nr:hypothetical protein [Echinicola soli]QDH78468.1 hypothetical protein FKX85_05245 [Echinicola soli]